MDPAVKNLSHCALLFQICGHQYFSVKSLSSRNQSQYPSWGYTTYFFIVFITLTSKIIIFVLLASSEEVEVELSPKTAVNYIVQHSMYFGLIFIIFIGIIQSFATTPLTKQIFINSIRISSLSQKEFSYMFDYQDLKKKNLKYLIFLILSWTPIEIIFFSLLRRFDEKAFSITLMVILPIFYLRATAFKFVFHVEMINYQLENILKLLSKAISEDETFGGGVRLFIKPVKIKTVPEITMKIKNLRKILNIVYENSELVNRTNGLTILSLVAVMVINITGSGELQSIAKLRVFAYKNVF